MAKCRWGVSGGALPEVPTYPTTSPRADAVAFLQSPRVTLEVGVVVAVPLLGIELVDRVSAGDALEQLGDGAVGHRQHRGVARREDVDRLVAAAIAAGLVEVVDQLIALDAFDG